MVADPLWRDFADALSRGDDAAVARELAALGRAGFAQGFLGGARQHQRAQSRRFADRLARSTYDKLLSLAEAVGALRLENPENGPWGLNPRTAPAELFAAVAAALGADLAPPAHVGGYLGIAAGEGIVLHQRMLEAIHAAWRLRQLADALGLGAGARIAEIGGGAGLTAFYARRLGLRNYRLYDRPPMSAVQAYVLADGPEQPASVLPETSFAAAKPGSVDLLFDSDSLPAMERARAAAHLAAARRMGVRHILGINAEAPLPDRTAMGDLAAEAGGYRLASRHRHWLRAGYVEEHYVLRSGSSGSRFGWLRIGSRA
jgi:hypothetical protein